MTFTEQYNKMLKEIEEIRKGCGMIQSLGRGKCPTDMCDDCLYNLAIAQAKLQTFKERCEDELRFLEEHEIEIGLSYGDSATVSMSPDWLKQRISDLKSVVTQVLRTEVLK